MNEANTALPNLVTQGQMATPILIRKGADGKSVNSRGLPMIWQLTLPRPIDRLLAAPRY